jgi:hypothetical protein
MRKLSHILIATALSTLAFSSLTITTCAAEDDAVETARPPYKPGRQIDGAEPVKSGRAPYKPGRQLDDASSAGDTAAAPSAASSDDGPQPVSTGRAPYKPGRQADEKEGVH